MAGNENESWFNNSRLGILTLVLNLLCLAYLGVIQGNDLKNQVKAHDDRLDKNDAQILALEATKVSKETFQILLNNMTDVKGDVRDVKADVRELINRN